MTGANAAISYDSGLCRPVPMVSDVLLARRWPNGRIPYQFDASFLAQPVCRPGSGPCSNAGNSQAGSEAEIEEAMGIDRGLSSCGAPGCVGWAEENAVRFERCSDASCSQERYYANFINDCCNHTNTKRGFAGANGFELRPDCDLATDRSCRIGGYPGLTTLQLQTPLPPSWQNGRVLCTQSESLCAQQGVTNRRPRPCDHAANESCVFDIWLRGDSANFMMNAGHEIGHMLGFNHEQARWDREEFLDDSPFYAAGASESRARQWEASVLPREFFIGAWDGESVMLVPSGGSEENYQPRDGIPLNTQSRNGNVPTPTDLDRLKRLYGVNGDWISGPEDTWCLTVRRRGERGATSQVVIGQFDGQAGVDLMCFRRATGRLEFDFAAPAATTRGPVFFRQDGDADSSAATRFCRWPTRSSGGEILVGNFNPQNPGEELLCSDEGSLLGLLGGDDDHPDGDVLLVATGYCDQAGDRLVAGRFDDDSTTDLLCHNSQSGNWTLDLNLVGGGLGTPDLTSMAGWCSGGNNQLFTGDFDGDGIDDLLCHDWSDGSREIDYGADGVGGTDWTSTESPGASFCSQGSDLLRLLIGDIDADGRDDLICFNRHRGSVSLNLATHASRESGNRLWGEDWFGDISLCNARDAELFAVDVNANGRADLLCHNGATGQKVVRFATPEGRY